LPLFEPFSSHQPQTLYSQRLMAFLFRKLPVGSCQAKNKHFLMYFTLIINDVIYICCQEQIELLSKGACYETHYAKKIKTKVASH
jgi:hypothetical protein